METSLHLKVCCNIGYFYCDQVSSPSKRHMSRPCLSIATRVFSSFIFTTYITLSRQMLILSVSGHILPYRNRGLSLKLFFCLNKIFHVAIIIVVIEGPLSRHNFCFLPVSFVSTRASFLRQILPGVDILVKNLVATKTFFVSGELLYSSHFLSRHVVFCLDKAPFPLSWTFVVTHKTLSGYKLLQLLFFLFFLAGIFSF